MMTFTVEYEREDDDRWLAEVVQMPGVVAHGITSNEAIARAQRWLCGYLLTNLSMEKRPLNL